eukprot:tig00021432_g21232.t1
MSGAYEVIDLDAQPELWPAALALLSEQWHKSESARDAQRRAAGSQLPCRLLLVPAEDRTRVVGHVKLSKAIPVDEAERDASADGVGVIESLLVDPSLRRAGLGRLLMRAAEELATSLGMRACYLSCQSDVAPFYATLGYAESGPAVAWNASLARLGASGALGIAALFPARPAAPQGGQGVSRWYRKQLGEAGGS